MLLCGLFCLVLFPRLKPLIALHVASCLHGPLFALPDSLAYLLVVPLDVLRALPPLSFLGLDLRAQAIVVPFLHSQRAVLRASACALPALAPSVAVTRARLLALGAAVGALRPLVILA